MQILATILAVSVLSRPALIPQPRQLEEIGPKVLLPAQVTVALAQGQAHDDDARFAAGQLIDELKAHGIQAKLVVGKPSGGWWLFVGRPDADPALAALAKSRGLKLTDAMAEEGYALSITDAGAVLIAETDAGLFYGVQTIRQLLEPARSRAQLPAVRVHDWPTMRLRGIMNDTSRQQVPTLETAKRIVDFCAHYKLNFYSPYIEHTFAWRGHEDIWRGSGAWSAEDFIELCKYARPRHVMIIPQFEAFGHQSHILTKPRYKHMAETKGWSFAPAVEDTYKLLDDLIGQMDKAFLFHSFFGIGCDEVWDMGRGKSKALMQKLGGRAQLFAYHIKRVHEILKKYGRRGMMWGDMMLHHPETMKLIPKDIIILDWHYGAAAHYSSVKRFRQAGYDVVVCPAVSGWVRIFPDLINAFVNIQNLIADGQDAGALGAMTCSWGDWGAENFIDYNWLPWAWAAACSWAPARQQNRDRFFRDFCWTFYGSRSTRLARAQWRMAEAQRAYPWSGSPLSHFHANPFKGKLANRLPPPARLTRFKQLVDEAEQLLADGEGNVRRNALTLQWLHHPILRFRYVYDRAAGVYAAAEAYTAAYEAKPSSPDRRAGIAKAIKILGGLKAQLAAVRDDFLRLWLAEARREGVDFDLRKFDAQLKAYDWVISQLRDAWKTGKLPAPASLGLLAPEKRGAMGLPVKVGQVTAGQWWDRRWPFRLPLVIDAGAVARPRMPVILRLNLPELSRAAVEPSSARLVVGGKAYPAQVIPLWTVEGLKPHAAVAFVLPKPLVPGEKLTAELYWSPATTPAPNGPTVKAWSEGGAVWIENDRMKLMLGREGAHIYRWHVKVLGGRDITQPGLTGWAGFLDVRGLRSARFDLKLLAAGPAVAMIDAVDRGGWHKIILAYAGLPLVETYLYDPVDWFWNYDATSNFAADSKTPGTARFADGTQAPVPRSDEHRHVVPKKPVRWGAKFRADRLTLGLITPRDDTIIRVGPGDGWGGIGIEKSPPTDWFVVYCDVVRDTWRAVAALADAMRADRPLTVIRGQVERISPGADS